MERGDGCDRRPDRRDRRGGATGGGRGGDSPGRVGDEGPKVDERREGGRQRGDGPGGQPGAELLPRGVRADRAGLEV